MRLGRKAFTLAELLLTLVIIGIIAALTVPVLLQDIQQQKLRNQWKAAYSILEQANKKALIDYGGSFKGAFSNATDMKDKLKNYFVYTKECNAANTFGNCWSAQTFYKNHSTSEWTPIPDIVLNNGMFFGFYVYNTNCTGNNYYSKSEICGAYEVDVNGFNPPNTIGEDIFFIHVLENRIRPAGVLESTNGMDIANCTSYGAGCGALYLQQ